LHETQFVPPSLSFGIVDTTLPVIVRSEAISGRMPITY
jgi:hypothetical protein